LAIFPFCLTYITALICRSFRPSVCKYSSVYISFLKITLNPLSSSNFGLGIPRRGSGLFY
jgi:hypothetical protein